MNELMEQVRMGVIGLTRFSFSLFKEQMCIKTFLILLSLIFIAVLSFDGIFLDREALKVIETWFKLSYGWTLHL